MCNKIFAHSCAEKLFKHMKYCFTLILTALLFSLPTLQAQESLTLAQAIEKGLQNNYQIQIADKNIEIAQNSNDWGVAGRYPSINLSLNSNNGYTKQNNPASFLTELSTLGNNIIPGADISWILFDGYRVKFTKAQLEQQVAQSESAAMITVENTIQSIILAYYQAQIQAEQLQVLENVLDLSRDRIDYENTKKEFGQSGTFDLLQTQDAYLNDSTNYLIQKNSFENAMRSLQLAMGEDDYSKAYTLADDLDFDAPGYDIGDMKERMLANNKNLQNLFVNRELAQINTRLTESGKYPRVSLSTGATYNTGVSNGTGLLSQRDSLGNQLELDLDGVSSSTFNYFLNLGVSYNLFDGGVRKRNIENAKMQEITAQLSIEDLKRNLNAQLENTFATYNNQRNLLQLTEDLLANASRNIEIAEERFRGGLINSFDYRTIQLAYINASQSRLNAIFNLKTTETELIRLMGGLVR
jgi:outer membrane protein TolC